MITKYDKEAFIASTNARINELKNLLKFYETTFQTVLRTFDGKVYNKRFINALKEVVSSEWQVRETTDSIQIIASKWCSSIKDYIKEWVTIRIIRDNGRINADGTLADHLHQTWIKNSYDRLVELQDCIVGYDIYEAAAKRLYEAIEEFNKNVPFHFREQVKKPYVEAYS